MNKRKTITLSIIFLFLGLTIYYFYPEERLPENIVIDKILVYKSKRQLLAYSNGQLIMTYKISLGGNPIGKKESEDDSKTPEGLYHIDGKNRYSDFHKNLGISYPNKSDEANAKRLSLKVGGDVKVHGLPNKLGIIGKFQRWYDWTDGCIGLTDQEIDELYSAVKTGTPIEIKP